MLPCWRFSPFTEHQILKKENNAKRKCWSFLEPSFKMTPHFKFVAVLDSSWMTGCWQKLAHLKHKSKERWGWFPFASLRDRIKDNFCQSSNSNLSQFLQTKYKSMKKSLISFFTKNGHCNSKAKWSNITLICW